MNEYEKLIKIIDNYEVISFDIFDTLLLRNVQKPIDIFKILAKEVKEKYHIDDFQKIRINSEQESRTIANKFETSLDEIYDVIKNKIEVKDKVIDAIKNREMALEKEFIIANPFMKKIYEYCLKKNKKVICITDMYLSKEFILELLKCNGYDIEVYLSCFYHAGKGDCTLYEEVYKQNKFDKSKWLHIGDNYFADYEKAMEFGISAYHYCKVLDRSIYNDSESISASIVNAITNNFANNGLELSYWEKFSILYATPIYFAFAKFIYNYNKDHDNIYFLARDGYIIKKIFDMITKKTNNKIDSRYLYTSRRAIQLPAAYYDDKTNAIDIITGVNWALNEKLEIAKVFKYFDLDVNKYQDIIEKHGFSLESVVTQEEFINYKQLISDIYEDIKIAMKEKLDLINNYLKEEKFFDYERINIVDIGWRGSIQNALKKISDKNIFGYYLATSYVSSLIFYDTKGFLLNFGEPEELADEIFDNIAMYEFLFSSPEGSLIGFKKDHDKIIPVLSDNNGYSKEIAIIMNKSLEIIEVILKYFDYLDDYNALDATFAYRKFIQDQKYEDLVQFSKLQTEVGYSDNTIAYVPIFTQKEIEENVPKFLEEIKKSMWHNAYLIKEINNQEEYKEYIKKIKKLNNNYYLKKAIKHPLKAIKFGIRKIIEMVR